MGGGRTIVVWLSVAELDRFPMGAHGRRPEGVPEPSVWPWGEAGFEDCRARARSSVISGCKLYATAWQFVSMTIPFTQGPVSREYVAGVPYNTQRLSSRRKMSSRLPRRLSL